MEVPQSTQGFIARLQEIRNTLLDAAQSNRDLVAKLVGSRPMADTPKQIGKAPESVDMLLVEIHSLSIELVKVSNQHHATFGSFSPGNTAGCSEGRVYA